MRYQLPPRRISMKHLFPSTALALFIGIGFAPMSAIRSQPTAGTIFSLIATK
jgi:hypothetical protein